MPQDVQRVAVAIVEQAGRYLVGKRAAGEVLAGCAEFPGGKCLPNEDAAACAVRECREETGLPVTAVRPIHACRHVYPHGTLDLEFWLCHPDSPQGTPDVRSGFQWIPAEALKSLQFPEANRAVIERLINCAPPAS
jgi:8-oxo-dGTP diphosphatase